MKRFDLVLEKLEDAAREIAATTAALREPLCRNKIAIKIAIEGGPYEPFPYLTIRQSSAETDDCVILNDRKDVDLMIAALRRLRSQLPTREAEQRENDIPPQKIRVQDPDGMWR